MKNKKPSQVQKLARTAARKVPSRVEIEENVEPPKIETTEKPESNATDSITSYLLSNIFPKFNTPEYWRSKVLEKREAHECKTQLELIELVVQLNEISEDFNGDFHATETFHTMYSEICRIQNSQNFTISSWKIIAIPVMIPPLGGGRVFLSGIFHSRANLDIFSNWSISDKNVDFNLLQQPFVESDVQREIQLDENGPPYTQERPIDWANRSMSNDSVTSAKNESGLNFDVSCPSTITSIDEQHFYEMKNEKRIDMADAMNIFHSIIEANSKDEHPVPRALSTPSKNVKNSFRAKSELKRNKKDEPLGRKMKRYIPMSFFAEFITSFIQKK